MGVTTEQLRAIERWENEGGKVSPALIMPSRQTEIRGNQNQPRNRKRQDEHQAKKGL
jgi:hypothetical protein